MQQKQGVINIAVGAVVNVLLIVLKLALGVLGRSQGLVADAFHSASDFATDIMAFAGLHIGRKEKDADHPFGHGKIETLMSLFIGVALVLTGIWLGLNGLSSMLAGASKPPTAPALVGAVLSIVAKEGLYWYTYLVGRRINSQVLVANAWHHRSDAFSSVAVVFGIGAALVNPQWAVADALAAVVVALLIIKVGFDITRPAFNAAVDTAPPDETLTEIRKAALSVAGVADAHDIHARLYANRMHVEIHAVVDPFISVLEGHGLANEVRRRIKEQIPDVIDVIVHVDPDESKVQ